MVKRRTFIVLSILCFVLLAAAGAYIYGADRSEPYEDYYLEFYKNAGEIEQQAFQDRRADFPVQESPKLSREEFVEKIENNFAYLEENISKLDMEKEETYTDLIYACAYNFSFSHYFGEEGPDSIQEKIQQSEISKVANAAHSYIVEGARKEADVEKIRKQIRGLDEEDYQAFADLVFEAAGNQRELKGGE